MSLPAIVVVAYGLLGLAWAMTNAPFAAPDEAAHYLRAVGISDGHWVGRRAVDPNPALTPKQRAWTDQAARSVSVPAGLSPGGIAPCESRHPALSAACSNRAPVNRTADNEVTSVGTYQPLPYLLPAAALRIADHGAGADRLGRLATLVVWLALLAAAVWMLWDATVGGVSLAGLLVAITPMVVFIGASLTGSSLEIISSIAFLAALLRIARPLAGSPRAAFAVAGVSGAVLALSRTPGPAWVAVDLIVWALLAGAETLAGLWRRARAPALVAAGAVLAAVAANRYWEARYGPHVTTSLVPPLESLSAGRRELFRALDELFGRFGYLDVPLGAVGVAIWALLGAALVGAAALLARARERWALALAFAIALLVPIYVFAAITRFTGFGLQARHVLAIIVILPLVAGELVRRHAPRLGVSRAREGFAAVAVGAGAIQLLAWWVNSRRYAVGTDGPWWFPSSAQWSPPGGWAPWVVIAIAGAVAIAAGAALDARGPERRLAPAQAPS